MGIEFNESDSFASFGQQFAVSDPPLVRLLKRWGIAQTTQQANLILIGVAVVAASLAVFIFWRSIRGPAPVEIPPEAMESMMQEETTLYEDTSGAPAMPRGPSY